ncbi:MAG: nuclear transport factor 2 family protein [Halomonas sp.]|uniref:nuclear transport factor 2 family protein n=1 Tax=Halomonas sp. TaxID=1486246 RepID=UPI002ACDD9A3|nr:nuclear transport factor 2 family protein [Halomonas sp.]MDZ7854148.1 nuclear transport factor 2 family protein [Halomonas sp.]
MRQSPDVKAFCAFFNKLDKTCTKKLYEVYTDDVDFTDPLHHIKGREALEDYFSTLYDNVTSCRFVFHTTLQKDDTAFVTWTMHLVHPRLDGGRVVEVEGCSHLIFAEDGRVTRHRDYFDAGDLLYERLPVMGPAVRWVKRQLTG